MYTDDRAGALGDQLPRAFWVEVVSRRIEITKHRLHPEPLQRVRCRHKSERWQNDLAGKVERPSQNLETGCCIANRNALPNAEQLTDSLLKLFYTRPIVGEPLALQNLVEASEELFSIANVGTADMQLGSKSWRTAEDREVLYAFFAAARFNRLIIHDLASAQPDTPSFRS